MAFLPQLGGHGKTNTTQHYKLIFKIDFVVWFFFVVAKVCYFGHKKTATCNSVYCQEKST